MRASPLHLTQFVAAAELQARAGAVARGSNDLRRLAICTFGLWLAQEHCSQPSTPLDQHHEQDADDAEGGDSTWHATLGHDWIGLSTRLPCLPAQPSSPAIPGSFVTGTFRMAAAVSFQAAVAKPTGVARPARRSVKVQVRARPPVAPIDRCKAGQPACGPCAHRLPPASPMSAGCCLQRPVCRGAGPDGGRCSSAQLPGSVRALMRREGSIPAKGFLAQSPCAPPPRPLPAAEADRQPRQGHSG